MDERQTPDHDGTPKPMTLTATLKRTLSGRCGCCVRDTVTVMYALLFWNYDKINMQENVGRIINGEQLLEPQGVVEPAHGFLAERQRQEERDKSRRVAQADADADADAHKTTSLEAGGRVVSEERTSEPVRADEAVQETAEPEPEPEVDTAADSDEDMSEAAAEEGMSLEERMANVKATKQRHDSVIGSDDGARDLA